jgi:hypothetical protein
LRELLAGHDKAILDPLDSRCLAARGGSSQATSGLSLPDGSGALASGCGAPANAARPWPREPLLGHRRAKAAEVFAEASNGGFELRNPAQQDRGTEIDAHTWILSKYGHQSKCRQWSKPL